VRIEGLEERRAEPSAPLPSAPSEERKVRLKAVDRQQICWRRIDPERWVEEDHPVRAIWDLLGQLDLSRFGAGIQAVEGRAGRDACAPQVLIARWLYALRRGVREARALDAWSPYEPGCPWLLGLGRINYHTLSDFVTEHAAALDELFVQVLHVLMAAGAAELIGSLGEKRVCNQARHGVQPAFFPEHFVYEAEHDRFTCPAGKWLAYQKSKPLVGATEKQYQAKARDCRECPLRPQCCPQAKRGRVVTRTEDDAKVAAFRQKMQRPEYQAIYRQRAQVAEFSNACLKEKRGWRRFLRRGLEKVRTELAWACLSCNGAIWTRRVWKVSRQVVTAPTCA
jgi:hypothetical protein